MTKNPLRVMTIVGARPQFVKAAVVSRAFADLNARAGTTLVAESIVHTGQHYDANMSDVFFEELRIPKPKAHLEAGSGTHGKQTGVMLERIEKVMLDDRPDWVLVYGDTNSTLAGALAASKLHIPVAHVEAGLRSFNRRMPEEVNRVVADVLSSLLLCPTRAAIRNLANEGVTRNVEFVGDVMYDSVLFHAQQSSDVVARLNLKPGEFHLATVHRAENTDHPERLAGIVTALTRLERNVILPLHPRARKALGGVAALAGGKVRVIDPVPYLDMIELEKNARIILTDSGGVQKEAFWFNRPCVTLRDETEWVELVEAGCNRIVGASADAIIEAVRAFESDGAKLPEDRPRDLYGDGHAGGKIADRILAAAGVAA